MKKLLLAVAAVALVAGAAQAREVETYVSVKGAWVNPHDSMKNRESGEVTKVTQDVPGIRAALGIATPIPSGVIRTELELGYMGASDEKDITEDNYTKVSMKAYSALANVYYDMCTTTAFRPYVGAGIGYARIKGRVKYADIEGMDSINRWSGSALAWQVGAGVGYKITKGWYADLGYRWADYGQKAHAGEKLKAKGHEVSLGLRYQF